MRILLTPGANTASAASTAQPGLGLNLPISVGSGSTVGASGRQLEILRVVAAAAALAAPEEALKRVEIAKETPSQVIQPALAKGDLAAVVAAIDGARQTPPADAAPDEVVAAARAVSASAKLVQAAHTVLSDVANAATLTKALDWVAAVDVSLLDRAARAGSREKFLDDQVPAPATQPQLDQRLKTLEDRSTALETGVNTLTTQVTAAETKLATAEAKLVTAEADIADLKTRVTRLESGGGPQ